MHAQLGKVPKLYTTFVHCLCNHFMLISHFIYDNINQVQLNHVRRRRRLEVGKSRIILLFLCESLRYISMFTSADV